MSQRRYVLPVPPQYMPRHVLSDALNNDFQSTGCFPETVNSSFILSADVQLPADDLQDAARLLRMRPAGLPSERLPPPTLMQPSTQSSHTSDRTTFSNSNDVCTKEDAGFNTPISCTSENESPEASITTESQPQNQNDGLETMEEDVSQRDRNRVVSPSKTHERTEKKPYRRPPLTFYTNELMTFPSKFSLHLPQIPPRVVNRQSITPKYILVIGTPLIDTSRVIHFALQESSGIGTIIGKQTLLGKTDNPCAGDSVGVTSRLRKLLQKAIRSSDDSTIILEGMPTELEEAKMLTGMLGPPELLVCLTLNARDATKRCQRFESMKDFHSFSKEVWEFDSQFDDITDYYKHLRIAIKVLDVAKFSITSLTLMLRALFIRGFFPAGGGGARSTLAQHQV